MIDRAQLSQLTPQRRAEVIYSEARAELAQSLWRAALGDSEERPESGGDLRSGPATGGLGSILEMLESMDGVAGRQQPAIALHVCPPAAAVTATEETSEAKPAAALTVGSNIRTDSLGPNARHRNAIASAAERTGLPAAALASIIEAEAAKGRDGSWNCHSRNPRSSAAGLGQFLSGTWQGEAERPGTWLNRLAEERGWLTAAGRVKADARSSLLALRYDPETSIHAIADYASGNLARLRKAGVEIGDGVSSVARAAYLGHHLGPGDAIRFLERGLDSSRARQLLFAQIGSSGASRRIAQAGTAAEAHREWLLSYVQGRIRPERFAG